VHSQSSSGADYSGMGEWNDNFPTAEDWDNEEYTGSLADTKVFTPSAVQRPSAAEVVEAMDREMAAAAKGAATGSLEAAASMLPQSLTSASKSLTPAQSQYFSQLTQAAATENLKAAVGVGGGSATNGPKEPISYVSAVNSGGYSANSANYPTSTPASYSATGEENASRIFIFDSVDMMKLSKLPYKLWRNSSEDFGICLT
jgi:hypothetical protein